MTKSELAKILKEHEDWLANPKLGKRADLSMADLYGANLSGADLSGANLSRANLSGANLYWADLSVLDSVGLERAKFVQVYLYKDNEWSTLDRNALLKMYERRKFDCNVEKLLYS